MIAVTSLDPDLSDFGFRFTRGPVAQLGARFHGMEEVAGSIPARSTNSLKKTNNNLDWQMAKHCVRVTT